jgi:hypothetical protein
MKKLFITTGCFAAIILMSSCTAETIVDAEKENLMTPSKISDPGISVSADGETIKDISH